jgi:hypothetical protein
MNTIEQAIKNYSKDPIILSGRVEPEELKKLCYQNFKWKIAFPDDWTSEDDALVVEPRLICLSPFLLISTREDDFYLPLKGSKKLVICLTPTTTYIDSLSEVFKKTQQVYSKNIYTGLNWYSLSGELMIDNRVDYRVIIIKAITESANKVVHTLIN